LRHVEANHGGAAPELMRCVEDLTNCGGSTPSFRRSVDAGSVGGGSASAWRLAYVDASTFLSVHSPVKRLCVKRKATYPVFICGEGNKQQRLSRGKSRMKKKIPEPTPIKKADVEIVHGTPDMQIVHSTPFVLEEPKQSYFQLEFAEHQSLLLLGHLAPAWLVHIERIHVVYQPLWKA
jgi:hypothetical protein